MKGTGAANGFPQEGGKTKRPPPGAALFLEFGRSTGIGEHFSSPRFWVEAYQLPIAHRLTGTGEHFSRTRPLSSRIKPPIRLSQAFQMAERPAVAPTIDAIRPSPYLGGDVRSRFRLLTRRLSGNIMVAATVYRGTFLRLPGNIL